MRPTHAPACAAAPVAHRATRGPPVRRRGACCCTGGCCMLERRAVVTDGVVPVARAHDVVGGAAAVAPAVPSGARLADEEWERATRRRRQAPGRRRSSPPARHARPDEGLVLQADDNPPGPSSGVLLTKVVCVFARGGVSVSRARWEFGPTRIPVTHIFGRELSCVHYVPRRPAPRH